MYYSVEENEMNINKSQEKAIRKIKNTITDTFHSSIENEEIQDTDYGAIWFGCDVVPKNCKSDLSRLLFEEHWFIQIGKRGRLIAYQYPKSVTQFKGKTWCGIHIR